MSEDSPDSFDAASIASALVGTWSYAAAEEPGGVGYLHFTGDGRAIQFVYDPQRPTRRIPMRLWYSVQSPTALRFRAKGNPDGWTCNYSFNGTTLTLLSHTRSFPCSRLTAEEIPLWFREALGARLLRP
jgi:hypothetical protein